MSQLKISRAGLHLIQSFEGFRAKAVPLSNGKYTIGFGHYLTAREGMVINRQQAEDLLRWDLIPIENAVRSLIYAPINQNQFDALISFVFNIGIEKFKQSDVLRHINQGQPVSAAISLSSWRRAHLHGRNIVVDALIRRRAQEMALFLEPIGARPAAPSPIVSPQLDYSASLLAPRPDAIKELKPVPHSAAFEITDSASKIDIVDAPIKGDDNENEAKSEELEPENPESEKPESEKPEPEKLESEKLDFEELKQFDDFKVEDDIDDAIFKTNSAELSDDVLGLELLDDGASNASIETNELAAEAINTIDKTADKAENEKIAEQAKRIEIVKISRPLDEIKASITQSSNTKPVSAPVVTPDVINPSLLKNIKSKKTKSKDIDISNVFMIGAGVIAFIAGAYEMFKAGIFVNGGKDVILTPSLIFIELVAASGLMAILIGIVSKIKGDEIKNSDK